MTGPLRLRRAEMPMPDDSVCETYYVVRDPEGRYCYMLFEEDVLLEHPEFMHDVGARQGYVNRMFQKGMVERKDPRT